MWENPPQWWSFPTTKRWSWKCSWTMFFKTWFWKSCSSDFLRRAGFFYDHLVNFSSIKLNIHGHKEKCHLGFDDYFEAMGGWDFIAREMTRRLGRFLPFTSNSLVRASICQPSPPDDEEWSCFSSERFITPIKDTKVKYFYLRMYIIIY